MNSLENISNVELEKLSNEELLEVYKIIKEYIEYLEQQRVNEDD